MGLKQPIYSMAPCTAGALALGLAALACNGESETTAPSPPVPAEASGVASNVGGPEGNMDASVGRPTPPSSAAAAPARSRGDGAAQPTGSNAPEVADAAVPSTSDASVPASRDPEDDGDPTCDLGVHDGKPPRILDLSGNTFAHDPTMIEVDGVFYRFWTGDFIPMATSSNLTDWDNGPSVYRGLYPDWASEWLSGVRDQTFNFPWAPDISQFAGRIHIYSSFSARFGANISCITHLSTEDIASGEWTDHGPVVCTDGSERYNAIDADVALDADGTPWLAFGSFWDGIMLAELDQEGNRVGTELTRLAWAREIEAPVLLRRCGYYYLFVTWGLCCPGAGRSVDQLSYRVVVGRSENITGPYVDREGKPMLEGGGTLLVEGDDTFAAAGHSDVLASGDTLYHLYHAYRLPRGDAELRIVEMPFDDEGWPIPAGP